MASVKAHFAPEFLNRLDDMVIFDRLSPNNLLKIVYVQLKDLQERLKERQISLSLSNNAAEFILAEAYNPLYGARPLKRYLEKHIATILSRMIISEQLVDNSVVDIDAINNNLSFSTKKLASKKRSPSPNCVFGEPEKGPIIEDLDEKMDVI